MNSYRFLFNSPCTGVPISSSRRTALVMSTRRRCRFLAGVRCGAWSDAMWYVSMNLPTPVLQVKSADVAEYKVRRCIMRNRACDVSFAIRKEIEKRRRKYIYLHKVYNETRVYLFFFAPRGNNYSTAVIVNSALGTTKRLAHLLFIAADVVSTLFN